MFHFYFTDFNEIEITWILRNHNFDGLKKVLNGRNQNENISIDEFF